ncbi:MAG: YihA family ribosome biogenesis GTP-binding protein [Acidiphilium sp. 34-60-192]|nr:MAG: YihA family ribosome biogenesis GTP-binding protein [Acidiphilium sp. 34-60-192]
MNQPQDDQAAIEAGRVLFAQGAQFFHAAQTRASLPPAEGAEIALAGRSNVGKSSLINAITGMRALARVSVTPGRTRQLNFFAVGNRGLVLVDMPGVRGRPNLRRVFLLLDARVEDKPADHAVMDLLDKAAMAFQLVLTKSDKLKPDALARKRAEVQALARKHPAALHDVIVTSSETGAGMDELRAVLAALAA